MKQVFITIAIIVFAFGLSGCGNGGFVNMLHGPDMSPNEVKELLHQDGYTAGQFRASGSPGDTVAILALCDTVLASPSPLEDNREALFNELGNVWIDYNTRQPDAKAMGMKWLVQRVALNVGLDVDQGAGEIVPTGGYKPELFKLFVGAYRDGVQRFQDEM